MKSKIDYTREFIITWKVNYASLQCKNGVDSIREVKKGTQNKWMNGELELIITNFLVEQVLTLDELLEHTGYELIDDFIMYNILDLYILNEIEDEILINEYLQDIYNDETIYFYERKEYIGTMTETSSVYYVFENKVDDNIIKILKKLNFTGNIIERKGLLK